MTSRIHFVERNAAPETGAKSDKVATRGSILVVSERETFVRTLGEFLPSGTGCDITSKTGSFASMNGHAADFAFDYDIVIFDADPDEKDEISAVKDLLSHREAETVFLAITKSDLSIAKARELRDIGVDDVLPLSITPESLKAIITKKLDAGRARNSQRSGPAGQVIAVTQARGGVGATTVAVNLACALVGKRKMFGRGEKKRVALLDLDIQFGNANVFLDLEDNNGFLQTIEAREAPDERFMKSVLQRHPLGVDVLCAPLPVAPLGSLQPAVLETVFDILQQEYDYVVVDLPRALVDWIQPVLDRTSQLAIVTDTSVPCIRQARRLINFFREDNVGLPVQVIVNREKRPLFWSEHLREAEKILEIKLNHWLPNNTALARKAVDLGQPVIDLKAGSDLGKALWSLASGLNSELRSKQQTSV